MKSMIGVRSCFLLLTSEGQVLIFDFGHSPFCDLLHT